MMPHHLHISHNGQMGRVTFIGYWAFIII